MKPAFKTLLSVASLFFSLLACGPGHPSDLLNDSRVQSRLSAAKAKVAGISDMTTRLALDGCTTVGLATQFFPAYDASVDHPTDPGRTAPNYEGTWNFNNCSIIATSDMTPANEPACAGTIAFSNQAGGRITQVNTSAQSSGSGSITFVVGTQGPGEGIMVQSNHAEGAGCTQDVINIFHTTGGTSPKEAWIFDAIVSSTCQAPTWKCVRTQMVKQ